MQAQRSIVGRTWDWLDGRYQLTPLMNALLHVEIPRSVRTYYLGGITLFFFMVQVITGILLALYYQPTPDSAYDSILFIMNQVNFGWLIRSIHSWSANLMILFCLLHLLRVFFQGAYKAPREITWGAGALLLGLTLGFGFTGYLLPWDQRAFWATTVGSEIAGAVPWVGEPLLVFLRSGPEVTGRTLSRFYGVHVLVLPATLLALLAVHLTLVHQQGLADPSRVITAGPGKAEVVALLS
jgi:quinol-cytochrome oxidoreductase complex cytochrome b subunit